MERLKNRVKRLEELLSAVHMIANWMQEPRRRPFLPGTTREWGAHLDALIDESGLLHCRADDGGKDGKA